jgi:hypothetical protein
MIHFASLIHELISIYRINKETCTYKMSFKFLHPGEVILTTVNVAVQFDSIFKRILKFSMDLGHYHISLGVPRLGTNTNVRPKHLSHESFFQIWICRALTFQPFPNHLNILLLSLAARSKQSSKDVGVYANTCTPQVNTTSSELNR